MPVLDKETHKKLIIELHERHEKLFALIMSRELTSSKEGAKSGSWINKESKSATIGTHLELQLAVDDFASILKQIKSLK